MKHSDWAELLDVFCWGVGKLMRPTFGNLMCGYEEYAHRRGTARLIQMMRRQELIAESGNGDQAVYRLTAKGRARVKVPDPESHWRRRWDGAWRVVMFDLPETRRQDRKELRQAFRAHRFGLLQRSVWIWPHDMADILRDIVQVRGAPATLCGFQTDDLFLCTDREIVRAAWPWEEIHRRQQDYLRHPLATEASLRDVRDLVRLGEWARVEKRAYEYAMVWDPLLPEALWPDGYRGREAHRHHVSLRALLPGRLAALQAS